MKRALTIIFWLGLFFLSGGKTAWAQYYFDHWTTDNGLPQNSIYTMLQTRDGYLWMATSDGLVRFDGLRFTIFNKSNTPGITSNRINNIFEDSHGDLWIGTDDGGLIRYHDRIFSPQNIGLPDKLILRIDEDEQGRLWVTTVKGIFRREGENFILESGKPDSPLAPFAADRVGANLARVGGWYLDEEGLHRFAHGRITTIHFGEEVKQLEIADCSEDDAGTVWINSRKRGTYQYKNGQLTLVATIDQMPLSGPHFVDRDGGLWVKVRQEKLSRYFKGKLTDYDLPEAQPTNLGINVFQDREGTLWIYNLVNGLYRARPQIITSIFNPAGYEYMQIYPLYQDRQGVVWLSHFADYQNGKFNNNPLAIKQFGLATTSIYEDGSDMLFGTTNGVIRLSNNRFSPIPELPFANIFALHRDRNGSLWAGLEQGLFRLDKNGQLRLFTANDGLANIDVKVIIETRAGRLWVGGYGGVTEYRDERFTAIPLAGMPSDRVRSLYEDNDGVLWIGTYDGGLGRWKDGKLTSYTTQTGLFNDGVFQILEDRFGFFWMSCNLGIYRVRKAELNDFAEGRTSSIHCTNFNKADGMRNVECNGGRQPAGFVAQDGKLWFPTQEGAAVVDPAAAPTNLQPPPVIIEECRLDNQSIPTRDGLRIEPNQSNLEIQYTGLSLIKSEQIKFRYRLLGLDANWTEAGSRRTAYFSHLPPGSYTFQVMAANSDGIWNLDGAALKINVIAPFYRTWWFLGLAITAILGMVIAAYQYRVRGLERARAAQETFSRRLIESQEHERQRIAAELHDSLGQNLMIIKNRALLGSMKTDSPEKSQEQFNQISDSVTQAIEEVREIAYNLRPYHLDRLGLTQTIEAMIERVAAASGIAFIVEVPPLDKLFNPEAEVSLYRVVQESVNNIVRHSGATEARVAVIRETQQVTLIISDNGRGFKNAERGLRSAESHSTIAPHSSGFGLTGIAERVRLLGGTFTIDSAPGKGTSITVRIDLRFEI